MIHFLILLAIISFVALAVSGSIYGSIVVGAVFLITALPAYAFKKGFYTLFLQFTHQNRPILSTVCAFVTLYILTLLLPVTSSADLYFSENLIVGYATALLFFTLDNFYYTNYPLFHHMKNLITFSHIPFARKQIYVVLGIISALEITLLVGLELPSFETMFIGAQENPLDWINTAIHQSTLIETCWIIVIAFSIPLIVGSFISVGFNASAIKQLFTVQPLPESSFPETYAKKSYFKYRFAQWTPFGCLVVYLTLLPVELVITSRITALAIIGLTVSSYAMIFLVGMRKKFSFYVAPFTFIPLFALFYLNAIPVSILDLSCFLIVVYQCCQILKLQFEPTDTVNKTIS